MPSDIINSRYQFLIGIYFIARAMFFTGKSLSSWPLVPPELASFSLSVEISKAA